MGDGILSCLPDVPGMSVCRHRRPHSFKFALVVGGGEEECKAGDALEKKINDVQKKKHRRTKKSRAVLSRRDF